MYLNGRVEASTDGRSGRLRFELDEHFSGLLQDEARILTLLIAPFELLEPNSRQSSREAL
jgi:hypothetical protein